MCLYNSGIYQSIVLNIYLNSIKSSLTECNDRKRFPIIFSPVFVFFVF